jgi:hypothetical protein
MYATMLSAFAPLIVKSGMCLCGVTKMSRSAALIMPGTLATTLKGGA